MTPEQEDALWDKCTKDAEGSDVERWRLAIRAAVAQERERCAKVCDDLHKLWQGGEVAADEYLSPMDCAAAIRRGDD